MVPASTSERAWARPWTTAISSSWCSGVVKARRAPAASRTPSRGAYSAAVAVAGVTATVWPAIVPTPGPKIGWSPTAGAAERAMASTGSALSEVRSQRSWSGRRWGATVAITPRVASIGTETITTSCRARKAAKGSRPVRPRTETSQPASP
jgi:hypothetical protein